MNPPKGKPPVPVPEVDVPDVSAWGRIDVRTAMAGMDVREASEALDAAIEALYEAETQSSGQPICAVKHPREARYDAVGFARRHNSERIIHRFAGLSKLTPQIDPFRQGAIADDVIRGEAGMISDKPNTNPVRCEVMHLHNGGETSVVITTGAGHTPLAPWHERSTIRARILLMHARSTMDALMRDGDGAEEFQQDCVCQAVHVMSLGAPEPLNKRDSVRNLATSPLNRGGVNVSWDRYDADPFENGRGALIMPSTTSLMMMRSGTTRSIWIGHAGRDIALAALDPLTILRAHDRTARLGYQEERR